MGLTRAAASWQPVQWQERVDGSAPEPPNLLDKVETPRSTWQLEFDTRRLGRIVNQCGERREGRRRETTAQKIALRLPFLDVADRALFRHPCRTEQRTQPRAVRISPISELRAEVIDRAWPSGTNHSTVICTVVQASPLAFGELPMKLMERAILNRPLRIEQVACRVVA